MTTVFQVFPSVWVARFFAPNMKIVCKRFGGYNQNDYLCSAFISSASVGPQPISARMRVDAQAALSNGQA